MMGMIGEIKLWGGKEAPRGWRFCDGSEIDYFQAGALSYVIQDNYGWTPGTSKIHLPNIDPVIDKDGKGTSRYIICIEGEFPQY
ncbi:MAG: phage tail protein [Microcystaceae cyanobacterium]